MYLCLLEQRLVALIRRAISNGELTERGLARRTGVSQPHLHHIVKGLRRPSPLVADRLLRGLSLSVLDLLDPEEVARKGPARAGESGVSQRPARPAATSR